MKRTDWEGATVLIYNLDCGGGYTWRKLLTTRLTVYFRCAFYFI
jgi:hypothetical protein